VHLEKEHCERYNVNVKLSLQCFHFPLEVWAQRYNVKDYATFHSFLAFASPSTLDFPQRRGCLCAPESLFFFKLNKKFFISFLISVFYLNLLPMSLKFFIH
jgi:hypothetical protein